MEEERDEREERQIQMKTEVAEGQVVTEIEGTEIMMFKKIDGKRAWSSKMRGRDS